MALHNAGIHLFSAGRYSTALEIMNELFQMETKKLINHRNRIEGEHFSSIDIKFACFLSKNLMLFSRSYCRQILNSISLLCYCYLRLNSHDLCTSIIQFFMQEQTIIELQANYQSFYQLIIYLKSVVMYINSSPISHIVSLLETSTNDNNNNKLISCGQLWPSYYLLAFLYYQIPSYDKSISLFEQCSKNQHFNVIESINNTAIIYSLQNKHYTSINLLTSSIDLISQTKLFCPDHFVIMWNLYLLLNKSTSNNNENYTGSSQYKMMEYLIKYCRTTMCNNINNNNNNNNIKNNNNNNNNNREHRIIVYNKNPFATYEAIDCMYILGRSALFAKYYDIAVEVYQYLFNYLILNVFFHLF